MPMVSIKRFWCIKQASKKTDFTVDPIWCGSLRLAQVRAIDFSKVHFQNNVKCIPLWPLFPLKESRKILGALYRVRKYFSQGGLADAFTSFVRPIYEYGHFMGASAVHLHKLDSVYRRWLRNNNFCHCLLVVRPVPLACCVSCQIFKVKALQIFCPPDVCDMLLMILFCCKVVLVTIHCTYLETVLWEWFHYLGHYPIESKGEEALLRGGLLFAIFSRVQRHCYSIWLISCIALFIA